MHMLFPLDKQIIFLYLPVIYCIVVSIAFQNPSIFIMLEQACSSISSNYPLLINLLQHTDQSSESTNSLSNRTIGALTPKPPRILRQIILRGEVIRHVQGHVTHRVIAVHASSSQTVHGWKHKA